MVIGANKSEITDLLISIDVPTGVAKTAVYLDGKSEVTSAAIQEATGLRQPQVSIALHELESHGWVTYTIYKTEGKGRPITLYSPTVPLTETVTKVYSGVKLEKLKKESNCCKRLKELIS